MPGYQQKLALIPAYAVFPGSVNFAKWRRNHKTRQMLASLNDGQLKDIGVTRAEARAEIAKPFWKD